MTDPFDTDFVEHCEHGNDWLGCSTLCICNHPCSNHDDKGCVNCECSAFSEWNAQVSQPFRKILNAILTMAILFAFGYGLTWLLVMWLNF